MEVNREKTEALNKRMRALGIDEKDIEERFILASGKGGQKVNKTASCVHLKHRPSGIDIKCARTRSRAQNRYYARQQLCSRMERIRKKQAQAREQEINRQRAQKAKRSPATKKRMLESKRRHSQKKQLRRRPQQNGD